MFKVYSASAGSGKTYNLVLDFLYYCFRPYLKRFKNLENPQKFECSTCLNYQNILAVTFTNNAAAEMKSRIVSKLYEIAFQSEEEQKRSGDYKNLYEKCFENDKSYWNFAPIFFKKCSQALLHDILFDYSRFTITTIDSFVQRIIRSSAVALGLTTNYDIQIQLSDFYNGAINLYVSELSESNSQLKIVADEILQSLEEKGKANVTDFLESSLRIIYGDAEKSYPFMQISGNTEDIVKDVYEWRTTYSTLKKDYPKTMTASLTLISQKAATVFADAERYGIIPQKKVSDFFLNLPYNEDHWLNLNGNSNKGLEHSKVSKELKSDSVFKKVTKHEDLIDGYAQQIIALKEDAKQIVYDFAKEFYTYKALAQNSNKLLVLATLRDKMDILKEQSSSFFLSESNTLIYKEITTNYGAEGLFEKVSSFKNFFLDEFQDTSKMQWEDLKPLLLNALSSPSSNDGNITLFGDVKQSIYRFRNGDVKLFYNLIDYNRLKDSERVLSSLLKKDDYFDKNLDTNWRSLPTIVNFNNNLFKFFSETLELGNYYKDVLQKVPVKSENNDFQNSLPDYSRGLVKIVIGDKESPKNIFDYWPEVDSEFANIVVPELPVELLETLIAVVDAQKRGYEFSDIMILSSSNDTCAQAANMLMAAQFPVVTVESLKISDNPAVNLIINTLYYYQNPNDNVRQATILKYFASKCNNADFFALLLENKSFDEKLQTLGKETFDSTLEEILSNPFVFAIKELIKYYEFDSQHNPFIADFLDLVSDFSKNHVTTIENFLEWWNDKVYGDNNTVPKLSLPSGQNAIRVMSIHKSKGLEAPVVITICKNPPPNLKSNAWLKSDRYNTPSYVTLDKSLQYSDFSDEYLRDVEDNKLDYLNKWYVDFTRAKEILYVIYGKPKKKTSSALSIGNTVLNFIENNPDVNKIDDNNFYFGDFQHKKAYSKEQKEDKSGDLKIYYSDFAFHGNRKFIITKEKDSASALGTEIHEILQKIRSFPDSEQEIEKITAMYPDSLRESLKKILTQILDNKELKTYFFVEAEDIVRNEVEIVTEDGTLKRPDRVVFKPDHVMIIDYKTGKEHNEEYEKQISEYKSYIEQLGYKDVRTRILYLSH